MVSRPCSAPILLCLVSIHCIPGSMGFAPTLSSLPGPVSRRPRAQFAEAVMAQGGGGQEDRRDVLLCIGAAAALFGSSVAPASSSAAPSTGLGGVDEPSVPESIRKAAAGLPGMGPPDVFFPPEYEGRWITDRLVKSVDFPTQGMDAATASSLKAREGKVERFESRFIRNNMKEAIVQDREFNERGSIAAVEGKTAGVRWAMSNPNELSVSYPGGEVRELKVTKRSAKLEGVNVEFSEFRREANLGFSGGSINGLVGVPDITATWIRGKYRMVPSGGIEGIILEYRMPGPTQDPNAAWAKIKYIIKMQRA